MQAFVIEREMRGPTDIARYIARDIVNMIQTGSHLRAFCVGTWRSLGSNTKYCQQALNGPQYSVAEPVRQVFLRAYGYGEEKLLECLRDVIESHVDAEDESSWSDSNLIDAAIYALAQAGKAIPSAWRGWLSPGFIERLIRALYLGGQEKRELYKRVISLAELARSIRMADATLDQIIGYSVQALNRLDDYAEADRQIGELEGRLSPSRFFLRGFWWRRKGDIEEAVKNYEKARKERVFSNATINQLAICYHILGEEGKLYKMIEDLGDGIYASPVLIDTKAFIELGNGNFGEAEKLIIRLAQDPEQAGRAARARAQLVRRRDNDVGAAVAILDEHIRGYPKDFSAIGLRGRLCAEAGYAGKAEADLAILVKENDPHRKVDVAYLESWIALARGDWRRARQYAEGMHQKSSTYRSHLRRILDHAIKDSGTTLVEKNGIKRELERLVVNMAKEKRTDLHMDYFDYSA